MKIAIALGLLFSLSTPALAKNGFHSYLKAGGMSQYVGSKLAKRGESMIRFEMLSPVSMTDRKFVAMVSGPSGRRTVWGTVHMPNGQIKKDTVKQER